MPYDNKLPRVLISENCISHLKMRVFWLSGPNGWPDKKLKHKGNVAHSTFRGGCVIDLVWKNYSLYVKIAIFSYKLDTLYNFQLNSDGKMSIVKIKSKTLWPEGTEKIEARKKSSLNFFLEFIRRESSKNRFPIFAISFNDFDLFNASKRQY